MSSTINNLNDYLIWNAAQTKNDVVKQPQNIYANGIIWNAYDTYLSVIFNKKFILNSKSKNENLNKAEIKSNLESLGINKELCQKILFDIWFGGGAGITVYDDSITYISAYEAVSCNLETYDFRKSRILHFKDERIFYHKNEIQGSYYLIKKDYDNFNNYYSVIDKCLTVLHTYNQVSKYNLNKAKKSFEREMFYQISSDTLLKIGENDNESEQVKKNAFNKNVFENIKERITSMMKSMSNLPKIIQSAITPVFVDTEIDLEKMIKFKDGLIKEIALCCNVPASSLGISNSANKSQSESDKDMLTNQAQNYTNIFCDVANYWLSQFYPSLSDDLYFSWEENETDETLQIREQNQKVLKFYTSNSANLEALGIEADLSKLVELANSVSIPDLFKLKVKDVKTDENIVDVISTVSPVLELRAVNTDNLRIKPVQIENWEANTKVQKAKIDIEKNLKRYIQSQLQKKTRSKEDFDKLYPKEEFKNSLELLSQEVLFDYNQANNTDYIDIESINNYIDDVVNITYAGKDDYLGIWKTIDEAILNNKSLEQVTKTTLTNIQGNLYIPLFNQTLDNVAVFDGAEGIATIAKNDLLVRKEHLDKQNKIWKLTDKQYWLEPHCRCDRFYGTIQDLINAGFQDINNYNQQLL